MKIISVAIILVMMFLHGCVTIPDVRNGEIRIYNESSNDKIYFSKHDRKFIKNYYKHHKKAKANKKLPKGLAKKEHLPYGLRKLDKLPSGLNGRRLPADLESNLVRLPKGYIRVVVYSDIVILNERTRIAVDIIHDVYK